MKRFIILFFDTFGRKKLAASAKMTNHDLGESKLSKDCDKNCDFSHKESPGISFRCLNGRISLTPCRSEFVIFNFKTSRTQNIG